ncbi:hypothetical protein SO694_00101017 [Aureococcus anophagefferens]|uniref:Glutaredoxin domain-containing protein n=1 Tax=Aureococcus anophagefferens TaxID=44056 RepID=A0ABR1FMW3_AURAN
MRESLDNGTIAMMPHASTQALDLQRRWPADPSESSPPRSSWRRPAASWRARCRGPRPCGGRPRARAPTAFFQQFLPNPEADAALDGFVSGSKAVLFSDGSAASQSAIEALKVSKTTKYTEVRLDQQPESGALVGSLKRRIGVSPPALIVNGAVFDAKRIDYLVKQDMMLPVFSALARPARSACPSRPPLLLAKTIN